MKKETINLFAHYEEDNLIDEDYKIQRKKYEEHRMEKLLEKELLEMKGNSCYLYQSDELYHFIELKKHLISWREDKRKNLLIDKYDFRNLFDSFDLQKYEDNNTPYPPPNKKIDKDRWLDLKEELIKENSDGK
jgi:hypothetical protein